MSYKKQDKKRVTKRKVHAPHSGKAYIKATMNNTLISITTDKGAVIAQRSSGYNYKGSRKSTSGSAEQAARELGEKVKSMGLASVSVIMKGPGAGREAVLKGFVAAGLSVVHLDDKTPVPHNGCRRPKERRM